MNQDTPDYSVIPHALSQNYVFRSQNGETVAGLGKTSMLGLYSCQLQTSLMSHSKHEEHQRDGRVAFIYVRGE